MRVPLEWLRKCWFLAGPTACGKTDLSLALARRLNAEIVALDSMTLYRGMDIGTAKPSAEIRAAVPHHLLDLLDPSEEFSVAEYVAAAEAAVRDVASRGRTPLFVGGTGLYLRAMLRGVFEGPPADWNLRRDLQAEADQHGVEHLHRKLQTLDPASAARLPAADLRRVIRALEVATLTGRPLSEQQQESPLPAEHRPPVFWLSPPRPWLHERIHCRIDQMLADGWLEEVRRLRSSPKGLGRTAGQGLGYQELSEHLEGRLDLPAATTAIRTRTRQFAKRQHTWFRNLIECRPIELTGHDTTSDLADRVLRLGGPAPP